MKRDAAQILITILLSAPLAGVILPWSRQADGFQLLGPLALAGFTILLYRTMGKVLDRDESGHLD